MANQKPTFAEIVTLMFCIWLMITFAICQIVINNAKSSLFKAILWNKAPRDLTELLADALSQSLEADADYRHVKAPWRCYLNACLLTPPCD